MVIIDYKLWFVIHFNLALLSLSEALWLILRTNFHPTHFRKVTCMQYSRQCYARDEVQDEWFQPWSRLKHGKVSFLLSCMHLVSQARQLADVWGYFGSLVWFRNGFSKIWNAWNEENQDYSRRIIYLVVSRPLEMLTFWVISLLWILFK